MDNRILSAFGAALLAVSAMSAGAQSAVALQDGLGTYHYSVSARVPLAQRYFDQGLRLYYAFNHAEAIRAFDEAARLDSTCAMCYWGAALSYGPNINVPMDSASGVAAYAALGRAMRAAPTVTPRERALIGALAERYVRVPSADRAKLDSAFSRAMRDVASRYPNDQDARTLYAESVMDLSPWSYWERDGSPRPQTRELVRHLEHVIAENKAHPGAHHFYIHAVEAVNPRRAVTIAERLAGLMPAAGHLVHMPGHIYIRVGRYLDAIEANEHAVHADEKFIRDQKPEFGAYLAGYYPHNFDFLAFAESMVGRGQQSIATGRKLATLVPPEMQRAPGMSFTQHHATKQLQLEVRFAKWADILATPAPAEDLTHARAMWHYARGRALAARGDVDSAATELEQLRRAAARPAAAEMRLEYNTSAAVLGVAFEVLAGNVAASRRDFARAVTHLRGAARLEDALVYGEPPEWTVPVRQELGLVLLAAGQPAKAEKVFREDLARFPENGWSLHGLARSLGAQTRPSEAAAVKRRFQRAWTSADLRLADLQE